MVNSTFAKALKKKREAMKLTQAEFATIINVNQSAISRWERGEQAPHMLIQRAVWIVLERDHA